jgi:hypothetical protein
VTQTKLYVFLVAFVDYSTRMRKVPTESAKSTTETFSSLKPSFPLPHVRGSVGWWHCPRNEIIEMATAIQLYLLRQSQVPSDKRDYR